jgi:3',5'-cyclic AMP phosphodiesterase CpdA
MVCLCGNHDVGNRPTKTSIERFTNAFGDDYLSFWVNGTYNIVLNSSLFSDPSGAEALYRDQLAWLEERLKYARDNRARSIFVFSHHPWFLYNDDEEADDLTGFIPYPKARGPREGGFPDSYFIIPRKYRQGVMELFKDFRVNAAFSGHFHQNLVSKASFGMDMIITGPLSMVFDSNGKPKDFDEPKTRGVRIVDVGSEKAFTHRFVSL